VTITVEQFTEDWGVLFGGDWGPGVEYLTASGLPRQTVEAITPGQLAEITHLWSERGDYAETTVHALVRLHDGRWAGVHGWCDTTGWDCQAGVTWFVGSRDEVIRDGLTEQDRNRFWPAETTTLPEETA
jgi:hypothetical protein